MCTLYAHTVSHTTYDESLASQCSNLCFHVIQDMQAYIGKEGITIKLGGARPASIGSKILKTSQTSSPSTYTCDVAQITESNYRILILIGIYKNY